MAGHAAACRVEPPQSSPLRLVRLSLKHVTDFKWKKKKKVFGVCAYSASMGFYLMCEHLLL